MSFKLSLGARDVFKKYGKLRCCLAIFLHEHHVLCTTKELIMKLLKLKDVIAMTSLSKASVYRQMNDGEFPASVKIGPRSVAWVSTEIESWIEEKRKLRHG